MSLDKKIIKEIERHRKIKNEIKIVSKIIFYFKVKGVINTIINWKLVVDALFE